MIQHRIIPVLLLKNGGLYKGVRFKDHKYVGDPINAVKIFNEKEVDELVFLDITASLEKRTPNFALLKDIASECFMPLAYGGGINSLDIIRETLRTGIEKVILNTSAVINPQLVNEAARYFGSSTIVVSIDVKKSFLGKQQVFINSGHEKTNLDPIDWAKKLESLGVGEIIINSIDRDGTLSGYDNELVKHITQAVAVPVIAAGGGKDLEDYAKVCTVYGASAASAGASFVFHGKHKAVLITYPSQAEIKNAFLSIK
jgi:cyclase